METMRERLTREADVSRSRLRAFGARQLRAAMGRRADGDVAELLRVWGVKMYRSLRKWAAGNGVRHGNMNDLVCIDAHVAGTRF